MKIAIICGAFNPPTKAHLELSLIIQKNIVVDKILYVPSKIKYINTEKEIVDKNMLFSEQERISFLERAIAEYNLKNVAVSNIEINSNKQLKTFETFSKLEEDNELYLVIGDDKLNDLIYWAQVDTLLSKYKVIVINRILNDSMEYVKNDKFLNKYVKQFLFINEPHTNISSTKIRERLNEFQQNKTYLKTFLPKCVYNELLIKYNKNNLI